MGKGNVTDDTIADIDKTQDNLTSSSIKMLAVNFLVRFFHFFKSFNFYLLTGWPGKGNGCQIDKQNTTDWGGHYTSYWGCSNKYEIKILS